MNSNTGHLWPSVIYLQLTVAKANPRETCVISGEFFFGNSLHFAASIQTITRSAVTKVHRALLLFSSHTVKGITVLTKSSFWSFTCSWLALEALFILFVSLLSCCEPGNEISFDSTKYRDSDFFARRNFVLTVYEISLRRTFARTKSFRNIAEISAIYRFNAMGYFAEISAKYRKNKAR